jgi:hypothetical protein
MGQQVCWMAGIDFLAEETISSPSCPLGSHPASYPMDIWDSFTCDLCLQHETDHLLPTTTIVKDVSSFISKPLWLSWYDAYAYPLSITSPKTLQHQSVSKTVTILQTPFFFWHEFPPPSEGISA